MGVYCYTRRKDVKVTEEGIEIVRFDYAYKCSGWYNTDYQRRIAVMHSHAERATDATSHVKYGVLGSWTYACEKEGLSIFEIDPDEEAIIDNNIGNYVGILRKNGRKLIIEWND